MVMAFQEIPFISFLFPAGKRELNDSTSYPAKKKGFSAIPVQNC